MLAATQSFPAASLATAPALRLLLLPLPLASLPALRPCSITCGVLRPVCTAAAASSSSSCRLLLLSLLRAALLLVSLRANREEEEEEEEEEERGAVPTPPFPHCCALLLHTTPPSQPTKSDYVCVRVCVSEGEREGRERDGGREKRRARANST